jgi:hypothetical protein
MLLHLHLKGELPKMFIIIISTKSVLSKFQFFGGRLQPSNPPPPTPDGRQEI